MNWKITYENFFITNILKVYKKADKKDYHINEEYNNFEGEKSIVYNRIYMIVFWL